MNIVVETLQNLASYLMIAIVCFGWVKLVYDDIFNPEYTAPKVNKDGFIALNLPDSILRHLPREGK